MNDPSKQIVLKMDVIEYINDINEWLFSNSNESKPKLTKRILGGIERFFNSLPQNRQNNRDKAQSIDYAQARLNEMFESPTRLTGAESLNKSFEAEEANRLTRPPIKKSERRFEEGYLDSITGVGFLDDQNSSSSLSQKAASALNNRKWGQERIDL